MSSPSVTFRTRLAGSGGKTGIVVPDDAVAALNAGRRPAVHVDVNGYAYRSTVAVMAGRCMIAVSSKVREATGLAAGDDLRVTLTVADAPREVVVPEDLASALARDDRARAFFDGLANSLQRYHVELVNEAKTAETRQRRIEKAVSLFLAGKKR